MGTKMAPNFANLYMAYFEKEYIFNYRIQPLYYRRYIDDVILIWPSTLEELQRFQEHVNQVHPTIKFTFEVSETNLSYLDINIHLEGDTVTVSPYFKKTNTFSPSLTGVGVAGPLRLEISATRFRGTS